MPSPQPSRNAELTALLIAPDRELAAELLEALAHGGVLQVVADLKTYPSHHALEIRLRQIRPDVILVDVGSEWTAAAEVIRSVQGMGTAIQAVAVHRNGDPDVLLNSLRVGASEFLHAPFDPDSQRQALGRLLRLRLPEAVIAPQAGTVVVFSSAKPGSGASTLAIQTACAIRRLTGKRVLLADFDLMAGCVGFYSKSVPPRSLAEAFPDGGELDPALWQSVVTDVGGVDVLAAPESPNAEQPDAARLNAVLEYARMRYDWILIDLPAVFERLSLMILSGADRALIVSTAELPSLHLTRKAVQLLNRLGFPKDRFQVLVNRVDRRDDAGLADMEKVLNVSIYSKFPNDYASLNRFVTLGQPLDPACKLGKAIDELALRISASGAPAVSAIQDKTIHVSKP